MQLQGLSVFVFSVLVSISLVAIADINRRSYGLIHIRDDAFQRGGAKHASSLEG